MAGTGNAAGRERKRRLPISVPIPEEGSLGPKMRKLTERERKFVYAMVVCGGDGIDAALAAGYGEKSDTEEQQVNAARQASFALARRERVQDAIVEEAKKRLTAGAMLAADRLITLLESGGLSARDEARVAVELLDRAGLVVQQKVEVVHKDEKQKEVVAEIMELAKHLGLDPTRLLGHNGPSRTIDAVFEVVDPEPAFKPTIPSELEDIL